MPRIIKRDRLRTNERAERAAIQRRRGYKKFIDPFPHVHGTLPEKMVYAELSRRRIPFLFLNDIRFQIPEIEFDKEFQADFVIPSLNLIIEVQGAYWHSMAKTIEADAFKFAIYQSKGYRVLAWWDYDIIGNLGDLFAADPALIAASRSDGNSATSELPVQSRKKQDTSKGIRTLNAKRGLRMQYKKKAARIKTTYRVKERYVTGTK